MSDIEEHGGLDGSLHLDRNVSVDRAPLNVRRLGNHGEWASVPPGEPPSSFDALLAFLLRSIYGLGSVQYLSVIHFPLKAGPR